jgi:hypothetical protein
MNTTRTRALLKLMRLGGIFHRHTLFVLGNQKSGTTAIAALLAELTSASVTLDIPGLYREPTQSAVLKGKRELADVIKRNRREFSRNIVKDPTLTFLYPQLVELYLDAKFLFIVRDPRDNIRSILNRLSVAGNLRSLDRKQMEEILPEWRLVLDAGWWGLPNDNYIVSMAHRWNKACDEFLRYKDNIVLVRYEDFTANKPRVLQAVAKKLGMKESQRIEHLVDVQYQPRGDRDASWEEFFGLENLRLIEDCCGERMASFGYSRG